MTRKEEIERVSVNHLYQHDYSYEEGEHLYLYIKGFIEGAKWADNNPKLIWHSSDEEPTENTVLVIDCDKGIKYYTLNYILTTFSPKNWKEIVEYIGIKHWCYIDNLLE